MTSINLRSDTQTLPTPAMLEAIATGQAPTCPRSMASISQRQHRRVTEET